MDKPGAGRMNMREAQEEVTRWQFDFATGGDDLASLCERASALMNDFANLIGDGEAVALMTVTEDGTRTYRDHPPYPGDPDVDAGTHWLYLHPPVRGPVVAWVSRFGHQTRALTFYKPTDKRECHECRPLTYLTEEE